MISDGRWRIAAAPVSYGVYGPARDTDPIALLDEIASAGFDGLELGGPGLFGNPRQTALLLADRGLAAVGAYAALHGGTADRRRADLEAVLRTCEELAECGGGRVVLADAGAADLTRHAGERDSARRRFHDNGGMARLADRVGDAVELADSVGIPASFHPHLCTYVEDSADIAALLDHVTVSLTIDTGHAVLAGDDPVEWFRRWAHLVDHLHIKDVRLAELKSAADTGRSDYPAWWGSLFAPLGDGDAALAEFAAEVVRSGYDGWLVVEHDADPLRPPPLVVSAAEQRRNLAWLREALAVTASAFAPP